MFTQELEFFRAHQEELVEKYAGQYLVIIGESVVGAYDSALEAYTAAKAEHELGSFMIQPCVPGPAAYTVTLASAALVDYA